MKKKTFLILFLLIAIFATIWVLIEAKNKQNSINKKLALPEPLPEVVPTYSFAGSGGGGGSSTPVTGLTITSVGQTVTGVTSPQSWHTVAAPARVINLQATPSGTYSGTATLKTTGGTVLHTEAITNLEVTNTGYPAVYFNPTNPVWGLTAAGTYVMEVALTIAGTLYKATTNLTISNEDLGIGGISGVSVQDYSVSNGNEVALNLAGGTIGQSVTIQLKQAGAVVGTITAPYANSLTVTTNQYGYLDVFVDNTDIGGVYVPHIITGAWTVERAKVDENNGFLNLQFAKIGNSFVVTDSGSNGYANIEYWHNATYLGATIPANYTVEPQIDHHITKKGWGAGGNWISGNGDTNPKQKAQTTFKIVSA